VTGVKKLSRNGARRGSRGRKRAGTLYSLEKKRERARARGEEGTVHGGERQTAAIGGARRGRPARVEGDTALKHSMEESAIRKRGL